MKLTLPQIATLVGILAMLVAIGHWSGMIEFRSSEDDSRLDKMEERVAQLQAEMAAFRAGLEGVIQRFNSAEQRMIRRGIDDARQAFTARPPGG